MNANHHFVETLLLQVPELKPVFDEHIHDNDELLPHVFMGDVTRFVVDLHENALKGDAASTASSDALRRTLDTLESAMRSGNEEVQELIAVSFLENLDQDDVNYTKLRSLLGESLVEQLTKYEG